MHQDLAELDLPEQGFRVQLLTWRALLDRPLTSYYLVLGITLLLLGEKTVINRPREAADRANALLPDVEVEIVPGAGHDLPVARPELVAARILQFVNNPSRTMSGSN